jgi:hypothetical protein
MTEGLDVTAEVDIVQQRENARCLIRQREPIDCYEQLLFPYAF